MKTNDEFKFPYFLVGTGLGWVVVAPRLGEETRKSLRERNNKGHDTLNQQDGKLREVSKGMVEKGKEFVGTR
jgi:hypothetical protein